jgi:hypothetical protein
LRISQSIGKQTNTRHQNWKNKEKKKYITEIHDIEENGRRTKCQTKKFQTNYCAHRIGVAQPKNKNPTVASRILFFSELCGFLLFFFFPYGWASGWVDIRSKRASTVFQKNIKKKEQMEEKVLRASGRNKERGSDVSLMSKFDSLIRRAGRAAGPKIETKRTKRHSISQERETGEKGKYIDEFIL